MNDVVHYQPPACLNCIKVPGNNCDCIAVYKFNMQHLDDEHGQIYCSRQEKFHADISKLEEA